MQETTPLSLTLMQAADFHGPVEIAAHENGFVSKIVAPSTVIAAALLRHKRQELANEEIASAVVILSMGADTKTHENVLFH